MKADRGKVTSHFRAQLRVRTATHRATALEGTNLHLVRRLAIVRQTLKKILGVILERKSGA